MSKGVCWLPWPRESKSGLHYVGCPTYFLDMEAIPPTLDPQCARCEETMDRVAVLQLGGNLVSHLISAQDVDIAVPIWSSRLPG
jgi:hypothetical protein